MSIFVEYALTVYNNTHARTHTHTHSDDA